jgi:hypothetical protein
MRKQDRVKLKEIRLEKQEEAAEGENYDVTGRIYRVNF